MWEETPEPNTILRPQGVLQSVEMCQYLRTTAVLCIDKCIGIRSLYVILATSKQHTIVSEARRSPAAPRSIHVPLSLALRHSVDQAHSSAEIHHKKHSVKL